MASPGLQSFCCMFQNTTEAQTERHDVRMSSEGLHVYNILCLVASSISVIGATYQLWPKRSATVPKGRKEAESFLRQNSIICWLALADLLASVGILLRSALWLAGHIPLNEIQNDGKLDFAHLFCAISSGLIQYFYICTYFWTFCYAIDTYRLSRNKNSFMRLYHVFSWLFSAVITGVGLVTLYDPALLKCERVISHLLPHYLSSYLPILLVLVLNPVIYYKTSKSVREGLVSRGRFTDQERRILSAVNEKFLLVILVFYVCWLPNIINGLLLLVRSHVPHSIFMGLWMFMGLVNPVQAFLNTLVYRGAGGLNCHCASGISTGSRNQIQDSMNVSSEHSPLLASRRS